MAEEQKNRLDFTKIARDFDSLLKGIELKLEREFPAEKAVTGSREILWFTFRVAINTYRTIRYICADTPPDPDRRAEYVVSCPPMVRTLADALFSMVFLLEDVEKRAEWYHKSGWREHQEMLKRHQETYGGFPEWQDWLHDVEEKQEAARPMFGISDKEALDLSLIPYWPIPNQMIRIGLRKGDTVPPSREFLEYLRDWFYRELSQESHLSFPGLATRGSLLIKADQGHDDADAMLHKFKSTVMFVTITMLLAICSELEAYFGFGFRDRLIVLWSIVQDSSPIPREVFEKRYRSLLSV